MDKVSINVYAKWRPRYVFAYKLYFTNTSKQHVTQYLALAICTHTIISLSLLSPRIKHNTKYNIIIDDFIYLNLCKNKYSLPFSESLPSSVT